MKRLGIDYGRRRVGLAITDEAGNFAYPLEVLPNDNKLLPLLKALCERERVGEIVLGESLNFAREPNPLMRPLRKFKDKLEQFVDLPIMWEDETLTTREAARELGGDELLDARAAAIILRNFLERQRP